MQYKSRSADVSRKMVKLFQIVLDPPQSSNDYDANSEVTGYVHLVTNEAKSDYNTIVVSLKGHATVQWSEGCIVQRTYHACENFIAKNTILWSKENVPEHHLAPGTHNFKFSLRFDSGSQSGLLPSSLRDAHGSIVYKLEAVITKTASLKAHKKFEIELPFKAIKDLNCIQGIMEPKIAQVDKNLCCICCVSGPVSLTARILRIGFCIGIDAVPYEIYVENGSDRDISYLVVTLSKQTVYNVSQPPRSRIENENIQVDFIKTTIRPDESSSLKPPPLPLSNTDLVPSIDTSRIIELNYYLKVEAEIHGAVNPFVQFKLVLGNIPLKSH